MEGEKKQWPEYRAASGGGVGLSMLLHPGSISLKGGKVISTGLSLRLPFKLLLYEGLALFDLALGGDIQRSKTSYTVKFHCFSSMSVANGHLERPVLVESPLIQMSLMSVGCSSAYAFDPMWSILLM